MTMALWLAQTLLVAIFFITGSIKLTQPRLELAAGPMRWAAEVSDARFRTIGALEVLAALGLLLPSALNAPILSTLAGSVVPLTMIGAIARHARCGETERIAFPALLLVISIFRRARGAGALGGSTCGRGPGPRVLPVTSTHPVGGRAAPAGARRRPPRS